MEMTQIYELANQVTSEVLGESAPQVVDAKTLVDAGKQVLNSGDDSMVDHYAKALVNRIGRTIFVNRPYDGFAPSVLMDGWEYGSICQKIYTDLPEAEENETWELEDGRSYDQNIFYKPNINQKFYNKRVTFEIPRSIAERQVKESLTSAEMFNQLVSMLQTAVQNGMTLKVDGLVQTTIAAMIAITLQSEYGDTASVNYAAKTGVRAINLFYMYKQAFPDSDITVESALFNPDFIRYATAIIQVTRDRMRKLSVLFNTGGEARFTPQDRMHMILFSDFARFAEVYLQSNTFHDSLVRLENYTSVPYWQGSGEDYAFATTSAVNILAPNATNAVNVTGILGVLFDREALGVTNLDRRVTTHYNAKAEFWNNFYKFEAGYFVDGNENFVVFFIA